MIAVIDPFWGVVAGVVPATLIAAASLVGVIKTYRQSKVNHRQVEEQVQPNGGSSMKDALNRLEQGHRNFMGEFLDFRVSDAAWKARHEEHHDNEENA